MHQAASRTHTHIHTHNMSHHSYFAAERARVSTRSDKVEENEEEQEKKGTPRQNVIRADTRHCALARDNRLVLVHGRTRESLLERFVTKLRGRTLSHPRRSYPSVSRCRARARTTHHSVDHPFCTPSFSHPLINLRPSSTCFFLLPYCSIPYFAFLFLSHTFAFSFPLFFLLLD